MKAQFVLNLVSSEKKYEVYEILAENCFQINEYSRAIVIQFFHLLEVYKRGLLTRQRYQNHVESLYVASSVMDEAPQLCGSLQQRMSLQLTFSTT